MDTMDDDNVYSYEPNALVQSYIRLKEKEEVFLQRSVFSSTTTTSHAPLVAAAVQFTGAGLPSSDVAGFCFRAEKAIEIACLQHHANLVLLPELWSGPYFCQSQEAVLMALAEPRQNHILLTRMQLLARMYQVVLPVSFYERENNVLYNSLVMIDADGTILSPVYRKSHIPDGTGYQEKFYFSPGDSGFQVYDTKVGKIGCAICWDQWNPECARVLALKGADIILYPTAIGSEPQNPTLDSSKHWQRCMQGHAAANMIPVLASNRFGAEVLLNADGSEKQRIHFYGKSFITDNTGEIIAECPDNTTEDPVVVISTTIDIRRNLNDRLAWGLFRDRRPELYGVLLTKDGKTRP